MTCTVVLDGYYLQLMASRPPLAGFVGGLLLLNITTSEFVRCLGYLDEFLINNKTSNKT